MRHIAESPRVHLLEKKWKSPIRELFRKWHWDGNLKHSEIGDRVGLPRATVTRWFRELNIPSQSCTRFTNLNLWSFRPNERQRAKPKVKHEFPWKVNHEFFEKWSEEMSYVLGFIVADGAVFTNPRGSKYLAFYSTDREIIEKISNAMLSNHKIGERSRQPPEKTLYVLQIGSKKFTLQLRKFGIIQNKSLVVRMPKNIPEKYFGHFVRGYFDGDGCIYFRKHKSKDRKNPRWTLTLRFRSGSYPLLKGLKRRLVRYVEGGCMHGSKETAWELVYSHRDTRAIFHLLFGAMRTNLCLTRKYSKYLEVMSWAGSSVG